MWFAGTGSLAKHNLILYQDFDVVAGSEPSGGNALVETVSSNGTVFAPVVNASPPNDCAGPADSGLRHGQRGNLRQSGCRSEDRERVHRPHLHRGLERGARSACL